MVNYHRTMKWHYDITMEPIMTSELIIVSHKYHGIIVLLVYSYTLILKVKYSNKYIFISNTLTGNDIKSWNSRI